MTLKQSFDQSTFIMAGVYGALSNQELVEAMKKDVNASMNATLIERFAFLQKSYSHFLKVFKKAISIEKHRSIMDNSPYQEEFRESVCKCKKMSLELARIAIRLINELKKKTPREIYNQQLWCLMFTIDKHEQYIINHDRT